jgi:hypothetical protein
MSDELKTQIIKLSGALETSGNTIVTLEKQLNDAKQIIAILEAEKKAWVIDKENQKKIIELQLGNGDGKIKELEGEIIELKRRIKAYQVAD